MIVIAIIKSIYEVREKYKKIERNNGVVEEGVTVSKTIFGKILEVLDGVFAGDSKKTIKRFKWGLVLFILFIFILMDPSIIFVILGLLLIYSL